MDRYGVRGHANNFFRSYLSNRKQYTLMNNHESSLKGIKYGVPQGSVLGPLLFLIYVNDMYKSTVNDSIAMFADDTSLTVYDKDSRIVTKKAKEEFLKLKFWCECNKLTINFDKTFFLLFAAKNKRIHHNIKELVCDDIVLKRSSSIKYIGIIIDDKLSFHEHVNFLCKSLYRYFGVFNKMKHYVSESFARQLYYAFVYSRISYGIEIFGNSSKTLTQRIQTIQSKLLKLLLNIDYRTPTNTLHKRMNILKVEDIYKNNLISLVSKCLRGSCPLPFKNYFKFYTSPYSQRQAKLDTPAFRTNLGSCQARIQGVKIYNNFPLEIRNQYRKICFKDKCFDYFIGKYI